MMRRVRGLIGLLILLTLAVGLPLVLAGTIGNPLHSWSSISAGDMSDQNVIAIMAAVAYLAWATFALAVLVELGETAAATITRRPRRDLRIPLLGVQQDLARTLIAAALLLAPAVISMVGPAAAAFAAQPPAATSTSTAPQATPVPAAGAADWAVATPSARTAAPVSSTSTYRIPAEGGMRSYWALAQHYLGDGQRWPEIWHLNQGHKQDDGSVMDSPQMLHRGWTVLIPATASTTSRGEHDVTVLAGDTLSGLAAHDGVSDWSTVWPANTGRVEPGGEHFTDPNLIKPGWTISLPNQPGTSTAPQVTSTSPVTLRGMHPAPPTTHTTQPPVTPSTPAQPTTSAPTQATTATSPASTAHSISSTSSSSSSSVVTVAEWAATLAAGSGVLAAGTFLALRRYRRRQFRHRRPGRAIAGPAQQHVPLEKVLVTAGAAAVRDVDFIDRALRGLAAAQLQADGRLPAVLAARLTELHFDLVLAEPQLEAPPAPWVAVSSTSWVLDKSAELAHVDEYDHIPAAPYPTLVSVGYTAAGEEWLIDLEQAGSLSFSGDPTRCLDLARFAVAELAHNPWSDHLTVTLAGFGQELVELNPARLTHTGDIPAAAAAAANDVAANRSLAEEEAVDVLHGRLHSVSGDAWMPQVLFVAPQWLEDAEDAEAVHTLLERVADRSSRTAVAVVLPGAQPSVVQPGLQLTAAADGTLRIPALSVVGTAQQLPVDQAEELALYLAALRDSATDVAMPAAGAKSYTDLAGAVLPEHTVPRPDQPAAGAASAAAASVALLPHLAVTAASLLPNSTSSYLVTTATTPAAIEALAPVVKPEIRDELLATNLDLDEALAAWHDPDSRLPKMKLLGKMTVTAFGPVPDGKLAITTEAVAYFALHRRGVEGDVFADEFWPYGRTDDELPAIARPGQRPRRKPYTMKDSNPKNLVSIVRSWLGTDPTTGAPCLPYAKSAGRASGTSLYQVRGLLLDWDLFSKLRTRGEARGVEGMPDLIAALDLVTDVPFKGLRPGGGAWLLPGGPVPGPETMSSAIIDVAHIVVTGALDAGDLLLARRIAEKAVDMRSGSDRPLLDLAAVCDAQGRKAELGATVRRIVTHHGVLEEEDVPKDTFEVMLRRGWIGLTQAS